MSPTDYEDEMCSGASSLAGLATVYDYERFFWDMDHTEGADIADLIQILSDANAGTGWNRTYLNDTNDVVYRLNDAVSSGPWLSPWAYQEGDNGVFR
jgi:hypothetical protein